MLPISALPTAPALPIPGETPAAQPGDAAQGADFLAILALQSGDPSAAQALPQAELPADPALVEAPAAAIPASVPASVLPTPGKILPPALPDMPEVPVLAAPAPEAPAAPSKAAQPLALARTLLARLRPEDEPAAPKVKVAVTEPDAAAPDELAEPQAQPVAIPVTLNLPVPETVAPALAATPAVMARPARPIPLTPPAAPQAEGAPAQQQSAPGQSAAPSPPPQIALTPVAETASPVAATFRIAAPPAEREQPQADPLTSVATPSAAPTLPAPVAMPQADPVTRPHDFGALVDRLVAAREALQPQTVSVAVRHAEFGPVQLHFRQEQAGLSVSLASADPDFARAVSLATPPVQPASSADSAAFGSATRQDQGGAATSSDTASQQRGQSFAQREERAARANPAPQARPRESGANQPQQPGIYA